MNAVIGVPSALLVIAAAAVALAKGRAALARITTEIPDPGDDVADMRGYGDPGPYEREADDPGPVIAEPPAGLNIHPERPAP